MEFNVINSVQSDDEIRCHIHETRNIFSQQFSIEKINSSAMIFSFFV
jgi:hypothetical protein